jgi:hypothetical protein
MCTVSSHKQALSGKKWNLVDYRQCILLQGLEEKEEINNEKQQNK